jgi:hypothetical protein
MVVGDRNRPTVRPDPDPPADQPLGGCSPSSPASTSTVTTVADPWTETLGGDGSRVLVTLLSSMSSGLCL